MEGWEEKKAEKEKQVWKEKAVITESNDEGVSAVQEAQKGTRERPLAASGRAAEGKGRNRTHSAPSPGLTGSSNRGFLNYTCVPFH